VNNAKRHAIGLNAIDDIAASRQGFNPKQPTDEQSDCE
jgi:hypothetical protein